MQKKTKFIMWGIALAVFTLVIVLYIPIMKRNHQIRVLEKEIAKIQKEIDLNSAKREECSANMATWNADNEKNRAIKEEMLDNLEEMLGFRLAGQ